jgi:hypothetical protein
VVAYITAWSNEDTLPTKMIARRSAGISYRDETPADRDPHGVLRRGVPSPPGQDRPDSGNVHNPRQRYAMRQLHCQVCTGPTDQNEDGTLRLLKDHRGDWPGVAGRKPLTSSGRLPAAPSST